ncbi:MAG: UDP-N-acetylmuramoyl-L-alanyl-D-glutamate--2,6-diaminopimelate ligase [Alphaproteobacteria bacterium]|nr:UDP-N-acetylmuramoyl-L-alanyl-D-glutamate--2,6-diaminopimelate ligase [Alphaproteobacteria bacterium]
MKKLADFFPVDDDLKNLSVTDVVDDSRKATPGSMFFAINGNASDGNIFIQDAIKNGAKFIVSRDENFSVEKRGDVVFFFVTNPRKELARVCSIFWPANFDHVVAVTGTNGKSSTVDIVRQIWIHSDINAASVGTLGIITKDSEIKGSLTSPGAIALHHIFEDFKKKNIKNVAMEASSHGLDQHRIDSINFSVCAFTNFTQDHLDYHKTFENYWLAKERLFSELGGDFFVINSDDIMSEKIEKIAREKNINCISYGKKSDQIKLISVREIDQYQKVKISFFEREIEFDLSLAGDFQVYNSLCAMGICYATGISIDSICESLKKLKPINGRLELVGQCNDASIYIDYAHTPDALKNAILSLRKHTKNRLLVVFGCGGNRDKDKRHLMGKIAKEFADIAVITDDNPRNEDPKSIRKMILDSCPDAKEIADRKEAVKFAINQLRSGDILLVAGKGHEDYQILAGGKIHFSDKEIILDEIK